MNKVKNILLWVFSIFVFLLGAMFIGESVISALLMFVVGVISNPLFLKRVHIKRIINIIACIVLFFTSVMLFSGSNTDTKPITSQSTEETTTKEKTTEEESTKSKKELEESKKESSITASKKAAKESSVAASKAEESRKAAEESSIAEASIQASIAQSSVQASAAQVSIEQSQQASIAQAQTPAPTPIGTHYVLNTNTHKFHYPSCEDVGKIAPQNYADFSGTRDEAIAQGYSPCGHCRP